MIVAISGCSGSGKTTVTNNLIHVFGKDKICYLSQDSYYKDLCHLPLKEREKINFDHPGTIEFDLFIQHLKELSNGRSVKKPIYNFNTHTREVRYETVVPRNIIILDGLHLLWKQEIRSLTDLKIFIDTDIDICFIRRLLRDMKERGRSINSVIKQYLTTVKPMQEKYIVPMKKYADIIIKNNNSDQSSIKDIVERIKRDCNL